VSVQCGSSPREICTIMCLSSSGGLLGLLQVCIRLQRRTPSFCTKQRPQGVSCMCVDRQRTHLQCCVCESAFRVDWIRLITVVAAHRACHRIRKACRHSGSQLLWYGCHAAPAAGQGCGRRTGALHASKACSADSLGSPACSMGQDHEVSPSPSGGSAFLQRCWKLEQHEQQQQQVQQQCEQQASPGLQCFSGPVSTLVAAATEVWLAAKHQVKAAPCMSAASCPELYSNRGREQQLPGKAGAAACWKATSSHHTLGAAAGFARQQGLRAAGVAAGSASRTRRVSSSCAPAMGPPGASRDECWNKNRWGGGHTLAH
jgi:hypothetical protein